jgi:putative RNA 2'-phosphotransferase
LSVNNEKLSKLVSYALRHDPAGYGLVLAPDGSVPLKDLVRAIRAQGGAWATLNASEVEAMVTGASKRRYEILGDRIRALYGHSVAVDDGMSAEPPRRLFHGTTTAAVKSIMVEGLRPMGRQRVHLSVDIATAQMVARRRTASPIVLAVDAKRAHDSGISFWQGNETPPPPASIPPQFLRTALR